MAATYTKITEAEMHEFLTGHGFKQVQIPGTHEKVYSRRADMHGLQLSFRVNTTVDQGKGGRKVGRDAIRCSLVWRCVYEANEYRDQEAKLFVVGRAVRVHRIQTWRTNLLSRIEQQSEMLGPPCPCCGSPMVIRENSRDGSEFYGCSTYAEGWCKATRPLTYTREWRDKGRMFVYRKCQCLAATTTRES